MKATICKAYMSLIISDMSINLSCNENNVSMLRCKLLGISSSTSGRFSSRVGFDAFGVAAVDVRLLMLPE